MKRLDMSVTKVIIFTLIADITARFRFCELLLGTESEDQRAEI